VNQPELEAFDQNGDGIVSFEELEHLLPANERLREVVVALQAKGIFGIKYTGCDEASSSGDGVAANGATEDLASLIARAAVARIYEGDA